jgi:hypothetical protein
VAYVGPTCQISTLTWTNRVVTRGSGLLTWPTLVLPRGTPSLFIYFFIPSASHTQFVPRAVVVPKLYPELS